MPRTTVHVSTKASLSTTLADLEQGDWFAFQSQPDSPIYIKGETRAEYYTYTQVTGLQRGMFYKHNQNLSVIPIASVSIQIEVKR